MMPKGKEFYNYHYNASNRYDVHYTKSRYYKLWVRVIGMLEKIGSKNIMSLGCGTGQFEEMLCDNGYDVIGVDFSDVAIEKAMGKSNAEFLCLDIVKAFNMYKDLIKGTVVILETLEHIDDLELLIQFKQGTNIVFMVPSKEEASHLRVFKTVDDILDRYGVVMDIDRASIEVHSDRFFICRGVIK